MKGRKGCRNEVAISEVKGGGRRMKGIEGGRVESRVEWKNEGMESGRKKRGRKVGGKV